MENSCLLDVLQGDEGNYILPFFWLHGREEKIIRKYMEKIQQTGIQAVCLESRPHPDFVGPQWWQDMDIILEEAKKRNMKVWILDDSHFPTGYANGKVATADDSLKKWHLIHQEFDICGPLKGYKLIIEPNRSFAVGMGETESIKTRIVSVVAAKRISDNSLEVKDEFIDLSDKLKGRYLQWDIPEGKYRIFVIMERLGGTLNQDDYICMIHEESVKLLIDEVYEPHYLHYKEEFGKTLAGFFSDEPSFGNCSKETGYSFDLKVGSDMLLPWSEKVEKRMSKSLGYDVKTVLPSLWFKCGEITEQVRFTYMDTITRLYQECFTGQLGRWCEEHNVEYIGHIIEDNNSHTRLGVSCGHYFRALKGQHMSGIDVVLQQIMPQMNYAHYGFAAHGVADGTFYYYGLAKLGSSMAHIDKNTQGRAMCEIYGAYGWVEDLSLMKWLADHMLVRGINQFVPHAFSEADFPDPDCPPHFYAHGMNPQYEHMRYLFQYINRASHLLSNGISATRIAVLYHAESEWMGEAMLFQEVGKELMENQIDYDVVPLDALLKSNVKEKHLYVGNAVYECLLIPWAEYYPEKLKQIAQILEKEDILVYWIEKLDRKSENAVGIENIADKMIKLGLRDIETKQSIPYLRFYHYFQMADNMDIYMFFNESTIEGIKTELSLNESKKIYLYDPYENRLLRIREAEDGFIKLYFAAGEVKYMIASLDELEVENESEYETLRECKWDIEFTISLADYHNIDRLTKRIVTRKLEDISVLQSNFAGKIRYEGKISLHNDLPKVLDLGKVYGSAELFLNGVSAGVKISEPYKFEISHLINEGINNICIEVLTSLVYAQEDNLSRNTMLPPLGMMGPVILFS